MAEINPFRLAVNIYMGQNYSFPVFWLPSKKNQRGVSVSPPSPCRQSWTLDFISFAFPCKGGGEGEGGIPLVSSIRWRTFATREEVSHVYEEK